MASYGVRIMRCEVNVLTIKRPFEPTQRTSPTSAHSRPPDRLSAGAVDRAQTRERIITATYAGHRVTPWSKHRNGRPRFGADWTAIKCTAGRRRRLFQSRGGARFDCECCKTRATAYSADTAGREEGWGTGCEPAQVEEKRRDDGGWRRRGGREPRANCRSVDCAACHGRSEWDGTVSGCWSTHVV